MVLPMVGRELRVASRRSSTYWARFRVVLAGMIPVTALSTGMITAAPALRLGQVIFQVLALLAFLFALFGSVRLTADALSAEKRDGTLGFLFLTDLRAYDVVLGKLAATSLGALYALVALLPVLAIPIMWGGVSVGDFLRLAAVLLNTLFFSLTLSMLVSALCWQERTAVGVAVLLLAGVGVGLPLVALMTLNWGTAGLASVLWLASPAYGCLHVPDALYGVAPGEFWFSFALVHAQGWILLALCCRVLPRVWQERPPEKARLRWREWSRWWLMGNAASRASFRTRLLEKNPIYWFGSRERRVAWYPWIFLGAMTMIVAACLMLMTQIEIVLIWLWGLSAFFKHWVTTQACVAFAADRDKGAMELLLSTSLGVKEMLRGHDLALRRQFLLPVLLVVVLQVSTLSVTARRSTIDPSVSVWLLLGVVVFVVDLFSWRWLGWWMGAVSKNFSHALATTYLRVLILPMLPFGLLLVVCHVADVPGEITEGMAMLAYLVLSVAIDVVYARWARRHLLMDLRAVASERSASGKGKAWRWLTHAAMHGATSRSDGLNS